MNLAGYKIYPVQVFVADHLEQNNTEWNAGHFW